MDNRMRLRKAIAIDFDGTLCENAYPNIGRARWPVIQRALEEQRRGTALILYTCRCGAKLDQAVAWCRARGLEFDAVNQNLPERVDLFGCDCRKIYADEYWDDKALAP